MATNTAQVAPPVRQDPRQVVNTLKKTINWNDAGVAAGVAFDNSLPQNAFILGVYVETVVAFDGTTPSLTVGTVSTGYNNIVAAGDLDETATGVTGPITRGAGRSLTAAGDVTPYVKLGLTNATAGQAIIVIVYEGGFVS